MIISTIKYNVPHSLLSGFLLFIIYKKSREYFITPIKTNTNIMFIDYCLVVYIVKLYNLLFVIRYFI